MPGPVLVHARQKKGTPHRQRVVFVPTPDIQVIDQASMWPHDAAALIKLTKRGQAEIIATLKGLTRPGYEVSVGEGYQRIIFKLVREDE